MPYDLRIPGWMPESELKILELAARTIPPGGRMVEVGSFCGRSSWCWAKSVDPSVQVTCLDIWNPTQHPYRPPARTDNPASVEADYGVAASEDLSVGTLANFQRYTHDCPNIRVIQGASPYDFQDWRDPLDLVFLDGLHNNPVFWDDLNFWFWKLKPGGLCCGDDFSREPSDVVWSVHDFAKNHGLTFFVQGRIWFIYRPPHPGFLTPFPPRKPVARRSRAQSASAKRRPSIKPFLR